MMVTHRCFPPHRFVDTHFSAAKLIADYLTVQEKLAFLQTHK